LQRDHSSGGPHRAAARKAFGRISRRLQGRDWPPAQAPRALVNRHSHPTHTKKRQAWASVVAAALAFSSLSGCGAKGDFGRVRPSLVRDDIHAWMGPVATGKKGDASSGHQLTDEERQLRDLAYPLIEPPYARNRWTSVLAEYGFSPPPAHIDRMAYASNLIQTPYRSQTARYSKLMEDIRNDVTRLDPFFSIAHYVTDMDRKREKSMAYVSDLGAEEYAHTVNRMRENAGIIRWVQASLQERAAAYQFALERLVIAAPSPVAVEAERSLTLLRHRISGYGA
jgi:hypothetical protein